jgi:hypothetical protein
MQLGTLWEVLMKATAVTVTLLLCALLALAACGEKPVPQSGVSGIVLIGKGGLLGAVASPSPLPGGFGSSADLVPRGGATVVITALSGARAGSEVARLKADADGLFRSQLPPGRYRIWAGLPGQPGGQTAVTVHAGGLARVKLRSGDSYLQGAVGS